MENIEYIRSKLTYAEQMAGLAEEATELAHAALKLRRVCDGTNPTPVTEKEAVANLIEEVGDVLLYLEVLGFPVEPEDYRKNMDAKLERWVRRMKGESQEDRENPKLLTMDELRKMDGEPVWVEEMNAWAIVGVDEGGRWDKIPFVNTTISNVRYGWNAESRNLHCYRHKPKEETP